MIHNSARRAALPLAEIQFPPILDSDDLARLMRRDSVSADNSRNKEALPPPCTPIGHKSPRWDLMVVLEWYRAFQVPLGEHLEKTREKFLTSPQDATKTKKIGAPTKSERIAKRQAAGGAK